MFVFLNYLKNFVGTQKRVRIIQAKRAIGVRVNEVLLYIKEDLYFRMDLGYRKAIWE